MSGSVDWVSLAYRLGTITDTGEGFSSRGGSEIGAAALADLLGPDILRSAVDAVLAQDRGSEVARSLLCLLRPEAGRQRCLEVIAESLPYPTSFWAGFLLSDLCGREWQPFYAPMAQHADPVIRGLSMRLLENTVMAGWLEYGEAIQLLEAHIADPLTAKQAQQMIGNMEEDLALEQASKAEGETG